MSAEQPNVEQQQQQLSANIHLLGDLLGETIIEQEGRDIFELEEEIRSLAKAWRGGDAAAGDQIRAMIPDLVDDLPKALAVLKAFTTYFQLVNLAEDEQRTQVLRRRTADAQTTGVPGRETIEEAITRLQTGRRDGRRDARHPQQPLHPPGAHRPPDRNQAPGDSDQAADDCGHAAAPQHRRPAAAWKPVS